MARPFPSLVSITEVEFVIGTCLVTAYQKSRRAASFGIRRSIIIISEGAPTPG